MDLSILSSMRSPGGTLVSAYLSRRNGPSAPVLSELLKPIRAGAAGLDHVAAMSIRSDADRIAELDARFDVDPAPSWAVFASHRDGVFEVIPLRHPVRHSVCSVGRRPYLRPLRTTPPMLRVGWVIVERSRVQVLVVDDDAAEVVANLETDRGKDNYGGFHGYEEHGASRHAAAETARILAAAAGALFELHKTSPFDLLLIGGHSQDLESLDPHLHAYLRAIPIDRVVVDPHSFTLAQVRERTALAATALLDQRGEALISAVLDGGTRPTARGTASVLEAANARAIDQLVIAGPFSRPGVVCDQCWWLARAADRCRVCGSEVEAVADVLGPAIESVIAHGGSAEEVGRASPLDADGVGAALRFPV